MAKTLNYDLGNDTTGCLDPLRVQTALRSIPSNEIGNTLAETFRAAAMRKDVRPDGRPVWTPLVACSVLLWFVPAMQCTSTLMVVRQETGGWKWPVFMLVYMNVLAYVACLVLYQGVSLLLGR